MLSSAKGMNIQPVGISLTCWPLNPF